MQHVASLQLTCGMPCSSLGCIVLFLLFFRQLHQAGFIGFNVCLGLGRQLGQLLGLDYAGLRKPMSKCISA